MIKVLSLQNTDGDTNDYLVQAIADTKAEVVAGDPFVGLPEGANIEFGSKVTTVKGDIGLMDSEGNWNWL